MTRKQSDSMGGRDLSTPAASRLCSFVQAARQRRVGGSRLVDGYGERLPSVRGGQRGRDSTWKCNEWVLGVDSEGERTGRVG